MRLYSWTNMYLSDIQKGIQTAHLVAELSIQGGSDGSDYDSWSRFGKTIIIYNGGNQENLKVLYDTLCPLAKNRYQYAFVREDKDSLNGSWTAVGIILPENFNTPEDREERIRLGIFGVDGYLNEYLKIDCLLAELLNKSHLA